MDDPETGEIAYFSHPIDIHFATRFANVFRFFSETGCAAKALFSCPAIISHRLESRIISNEPLENTEEESKII